MAKSFVPKKPITSSSNKRLSRLVEHQETPFCLINTMVALSLGSDDPIVQRGALRNLRGRRKFLREKHGEPRDLDAVRFFGFSSRK
ncbi:MAG: hypothetical protein UT63_C0043G0004 [Candidatus Gottesmanbacteria bacterium GW2011_GWC2_39_8]|uniref:Uncharacterized protein n=1 Tax=Candidatus Gottesmanbacteria bacterium GW2011_GWC2_39_8 TaxID=1618450 RepID=A0A0G0T3P2_9BACT|nr:MAG: hypothetical protein UT63_C0043G0004 [Candidatus Gottesmanbacteria bacterium GW2011_GWC2_39_8]